MIKMVNQPFQKLTGFKEKNLSGCDFCALFAVLRNRLDFPNKRETIISQPGHGYIRLWFQKFSLNPKAELYLMHASVCDDQESGGGDAAFPFRARTLYDFNNMISPVSEAATNCADLLYIHCATSTYTSL